MVVVIDCNIWITLNINGQIDFIADLSDIGITIATCSTLRNEITDVLNRPKLSKYISGFQVSKVVELHDLITVKHAIDKVVKVVTDLKDNYLFALSNKSKADYLITGDKLLLNIKSYKKTEIISLSDFRITISKL